MLEDIKNNSVIICDKVKKTQILKNAKKLLDIKFFTMQKFIKEYLFDYDEKAIIYLINKYNIKYEIALMYLKNIYYIENKKYDNKKLDFLVQIKEDLINNNLLIFNHHFKDYLKNKDIIIYKYNLNKFEKYILRDLNVKEILPKYQNYPCKIYEFNDIEDEIEFVAQEISKLIDSGVNINSIKLTNVSDDYINPINKIFGFYNLKIDKFHNIPIISTIIGSLFYENIDKGIEESLKTISEYKNTDIYSKIIDICNKYIWCKDKKDLKILIEYDLKHTYIDQTKYTNMIEVVDYKTYDFTFEYVFMLGFNQGIIPIIKKDEDYISDDIKMPYLDTTIDINKKEKIMTLNIIKNIKNLTITYKLKSSFSIYFPSNLIEELNGAKIKKEIDYHTSFSKLNNKIKLTKYIDNLIKFGEKNKNINLLNSNYKINYNSYSNKFTKLDNNKLNNYIKSLDKFNLSYSAFDNYNRCSFRFYVNKILSIDIKEDSFNKILGNLYHYILNKINEPNLDIKKEVDIYLKDISLSNSARFFINRSINNLDYLLNILRKQQKYSNLNHIETEKYIEFNLKDNINFKGFIDKIVYNNKIAAIIDYKTYVKKPNLKYLDYGIELQLPIYMMLARKIYKDINFAGFYLQNINLDIKSENDKEDSLKLIGYSNIDKNILKEFDSTYEDSLIIKSLKIKNDGNFTEASKKYMLNNKQIDDLINITETKVNETLSNILNGNFTINPKYNKGNIGCEFCNYKDICYRQESDFVNIKVSEFNE